MTAQTFSLYDGDDASLDITLTKDGSAFTPDGDWILVFSGKTNIKFKDRDSCFQKTTGAGIEVTGSTATVSLLREDTLNLGGNTVAISIRASNTVTHESVTVAMGSIEFAYVPTRNTVASVAIVTTNPPLPLVTVAGETLAADTQTPLVGTEVIPVVVGTTLKRTTLNAIKSFCGSSAAMVRSFRVLGNEEPVLYTDGGIRYNAADSWVSLPNVDEAEIGAFFEFYGYDSNGWPCGFYCNDGNYILPPSGAARNWFSVPSRARVTAHLNEAGLWQITVLDAGIMNYPFADGALGLNLVDGSRFYIGYINNTVTFALTGGVDGDRAEVMIGWTQGTPQLAFDSSIRMPDAASALMPIDLETWRSYSFECIYRGAYPTLKFPIQGPTIEGED